MENPASIASLMKHGVDSSSTSKNGVVVFSCEPICYDLRPGEHSTTLLIFSDMRRLANRRSAGDGGDDALVFVVAERRPCQLTFARRILYRCTSERRTKNGRRRPGGGKWRRAGRTGDAGLQTCFPGPRPSPDQQSPSDPFVRSIGPYHHKKADLQFMEKMKWSYLDYILKLNCKKSMRDYLLAIKDVENQARACYSSDINLDSKSFQHMLLLDGCFILVYLTGAQGVQGIERTDPGPGIKPDDKVANRPSENNANQKLDSVHEIELDTVDVSKQSSERENSTSIQNSSSVKWYDIFVLVDLFLIGQDQNQIPLFVKKLAENVSNYIEENLEYFTGTFGPYNSPNDFHHLLHLCHMQFKPRMILEESSHVQPHFGERFLGMFCKLFNISHGRNRQDEFCHSLLDVTFHDGVLEIPCLSVDDRTCFLFSNMVALEQTNPQFGNSITAYAFFMSQLISRPDDVTLLSQRGIIEHLLHSDKVVSALFTRLTKGVVFYFMGDFYLKSACWKMEMYYQSRINRWVAWLRHNHLSNPWLGLALLAGLLVLFCTIAQTVLTVIAYVGPQ
ncbi:hypothetical protein BS78_09G018100 [Paspalum vaginatum]|nr:hypothetical protein BS78_09G018100 [Paspalum vaginatum]